MLPAALEVLGRQYPVGTHPKWGFNYLPKGRAQLAAEDGIDLQKVVALASADTTGS